MTVNLNSGAAFMLTISLIVSLCVQQPSALETVYDVQKDLTTVRLPFTRISGEKDRYYTLDLSVSYSYSGKNKKIPESVNLEIMSVVKAHKLNSDLYVVFVADKELLHFGSNRSAVANPVKGRTWIGERIVFSIPLEKFEKLAGAKEVAIKMGGTLFPLSDETRESLRAFASEAQKQ